MGWNASVLKACIREATSTGLFTNKGLKFNQLNTIVKETRSVGKTPANTMSRCLQDLRDYGFISFLSPGHYKLIESRIEVSKVLLPKKKQSKGERLIAEILTELGITFETEKIFPNLKYRGFLRFDFYFEIYGRGVCIEFDGEQHRIPVQFFGGEDSFKRQQVCDSLKNEYCDRNGIILLRFDKTFTYKDIKLTIKEIIENIEPFIHVSLIPEKNSISVSFTL